MDVAWELAKGGAAHGTALLAMDQTHGRGRHGRAWVSERGGSLIMSALFRLEAGAVPQLSIIGGLAVVRAILATTGARPSIKWPNDVRLDGKKVCGVLGETRVDTDGAAVAVVGLGLNLDLDVARYPEIRDTATSLRAATGRSIGVPAAAEAVLDALDETYAQAMAGADIVADWRSVLDTLGERIIVGTGASRESGVAEDVAPDGGLLLRRADGSLIKITTDEVLSQG